MKSKLLIRACDGTSSAYRSTLISLIILFFTLDAKSQDTVVFRILTVKGNVMIDDVPATPGFVASSRSKVLSIGKDSYVGLLTTNGYACKFRKGRINIKGIERRIYN